MFAPVRAPPVSACEDEKKDSKGTQRELQRVRARASRNVGLPTQERLNPMPKKTQNIWRQKGDFLEGYEDLEENPFLPNGLDNTEAAVRTHFAQHSVDVVLNGPLG